MSVLNLVMAQLNPVVGDIDGNAQQVIDAVHRAGSEFGANLIVFPELMLTGYPPEDLLLRASLGLRVERALARICANTGDIYVVLGFPRQTPAGLLNQAAVIHRGNIIAEYSKQHLPNYQVFDEMRYFTAGSEPCVVDIAGIPMALSICEDIWQPGPMQQAAVAGARIMLNLNASPFHRQKQAQRQQLLRQRAEQGGMPVVYVNMVGGQDELVFDGGSMVVGANGEVQVAMANFQTGLQACQLDTDTLSCRGEIADPLPDLAAVYQALVTGVRDYVGKNGFSGVVLGLSGGIDSALTLALAVDALGSQQVEAIMMPFRYTSAMSIEDAAEQARRLKVDYRVISIEPMYEAFMQGLNEVFSGLPADTAEQNLQARCRGVLLMAISNKKGSLVLTTGNKSELAVGYSTLYGDMAGGFDILKDVPKTLVYELAAYRNRVSADIPERVITRPPSAELAPDQVDQDNLPPYDVLDQILYRYVELDESANTIISQGFDRTTVERVIRLVDLNEYKRRQAPVGVRITQRGFGRGQALSDYFALAAGRLNPASGAQIVCPVVELGRHVAIEQAEAQTVEPGAPVFFSPEPVDESTIVIQRRVFRVVGFQHGQAVIGQFGQPQQCIPLYHDGESVRGGWCLGEVFPVHNVPG